MSIILVGGHERMQNKYKDIGKRYGCKMKIFTNMPAKFDKRIGDADAIVLFTNFVSHKMMFTVTREAKKRNIPVLRCDNASGNCFGDAIKTLMI